MGHILMTSLSSAFRSSNFRLETEKAKKTSKMLIYIVNVGSPPLGHICHFHAVFWQKLWQIITFGLVRPIGNFGPVTNRTPGEWGGGNMATYNFAKFSKTCMKLREFGPRGAIW